VTMGASLNKVNTFNSNQSVIVDPNQNVTFFGYGLTIVSDAGNIALNWVEGNFNQLWGADLKGNNISISNSTFNNNISDSTRFIDDTGLLVESHGFSVSLNNVEANGNRLIGAKITSTSGASVSINGSRFSGNAGITCSVNGCPPGSQEYHGYGLNVFTSGVISVNDTFASDNNLYGALLDGSSVYVSNSTFDNNALGNGLTIKATDIVELDNVTATDNGLNGVEVSTTGSSCVNVIGGTFTGNAQYGISVSGTPINFTGTQTFGGNGVGDYQGTICVVTVAAPVASTVAFSTSNGPTEAPVVTGNDTPTTLSAGSTESNTTVSSEKKIKKAKKAHARHPRARAHKINRGR